MSTDLRKQKSCHVFNRFFDLNHDGYIDIEDVNIFISNICKARGWKQGQPEYKEVEQDFQRFLKYLLDELDTNRDGRVSLQEWTDLYDSFSKDPAKSPKWQSYFQTICYKACSRNQPNIKMIDYVDIMKGFGFSEDEATAAFKKLSNGRPSITEAEFYQQWHEYFTSEDPNVTGTNLGIFNPKFIQNI